MSLAEKLRRLLASRKFFIFIVVLFVAQALWLVFSFAYAMLWDEYYHFGLIQIYAHHLSPFITSQPHSADVYGEITRYPAYLYHYLMSFPYRLITVFTHDQTIQIIVLRIINVALFAGGLVAYRAAMLRLTKSRALVHFVLLVVVLFPLSSLLAATINYDNLLFLLTGLIFYWTFRFIQSKEFAFHWLALAIGVSLLTSVEKYEFLPIFAALVIFLTYWIIRSYGKHSFSLAVKSFKSLGLVSRLGLIILMLLGLGLFGERYGVNLVKYHAIQPSCDKVLSVERCQEYSPYARNFGFQLTKDSTNLMGPASFIKSTWVPRLFQQYFSTGTRLSYANYTIKAPMPIPYYTFIVASFFAVICALVAGRRLLRRPEVQLLALAMVALAAALFITNYGGYLRNGQPVAIQGRYLLTMVPFGLLLGALATRHVIKNRCLKYLLATIVIVGLLAGGGLITDIVRSEPRWYWHNQTVINVNDSAKRALGFLKL